MRVRMDGRGRVVVPKAVRDALGLRAPSILDAEIDDAGLWLRPVDVAADRLREVEGWPVLDEAPGPRMTDGDVRRLREQVQR